METMNELNDKNMALIRAEMAKDREDIAKSFEDIAKRDAEASKRELSMIITIVGLLVAGICVQIFLVS